MLGSIARVGAGTTAIVSTFEPVVTAVLAALFLHEALAARQYAGGALILSGVVLLRLATRVPAGPDV
jgi:drug/metabolite transporter (DMT)-like permease